MPNTLQDLPGMLPPVQPIETGEHVLYKECMVVVSDWQDFVPPSSSSLGTPFLGSRTSDVDELEHYLISPPGSKAKPTLMQELVDSNIAQLASLPSPEKVHLLIIPIDAIAGPRSERLGESLSNKSKSIGTANGACYFSYISHCISLTRNMAQSRVFPGPTAFATAG
ncbi:hypothetical protein FIBSPDRAFT_216515 [Athelia psychrophila]|uniref:Uncharacterized protein n=1 Tax=Athelia psychrophila TaxID=1759441 RepID=A0A166SF74_9AGAM|nr:hypothetical protein FIBSPDRAFT_216515 [Fibularhizoctonia sp. CBS 109695]